MLTLQSLLCLKLFKLAVKLTSAYLQMSNDGRAVCNATVNLLTPRLIQGLPSCHKLLWNTVLVFLGAEQLY
jgi:hypothetical protein